MTERLPRSPYAERRVSESLAGRVGLLDLETLAPEELAVALGEARRKSEIVALVARGRFAELWQVPDLPTSDFYAA